MAARDLKLQPIGGLLKWNDHITQVCMVNFQKPPRELENRIMTSVVVELLMGGKKNNKLYYALPDGTETLVARGKILAQIYCLPLAKTVTSCTRTKLDPVQGKRKDEPAQKPENTSKKQKVTTKKEKAKKILKDITRKSGESGKRSPSKKSKTVKIKEVEEESDGDDQVIVDGNVTMETHMWKTNE